MENLVTLSNRSASPPPTQSHSNAASIKECNRIEFGANEQSITEFDASLLKSSQKIKFASFSQQIDAIEEDVIKQSDHDDDSSSDAHEEIIEGFCFLTFTYESDLKVNFIFALKLITKSFEEKILRRTLRDLEISSLKLSELISFFFIFK